MGTLVQEIFGTVHVQLGPQLEKQTAASLQQGLRGKGGSWAPPARHGQKTRHNPPAKSKIGRVVTPPAVDPVELFVLTEHYWQYRQTVRALRQEFVTEVRRKVHEARAGDLAERKVLQDAAEHRELMAWNQAENQWLPELRRPGCGRRRGSRSGGQRRRRPGKRERRRPGPRSRSGKRCSCRRTQRPHHPREPGGAGGSGSGLPRELRLGHRQRGAGGQARAQGLPRSQ
ncbi:hypothetical protein ABFV05_018396 [Capra hircus]